MTGALAAAMTDPLAPVRYRPIGVLHTPFVDVDGMPVQPAVALGVRGMIELELAFTACLPDVDEFRDLILLSHLHEVRAARLGGFESASAGWPERPRFRNTRIQEAARAARQAEAADVHRRIGRYFAKVLAIVPAPRAKALLRLLIEKIRVVSPTDIRPAYRVPLEVRTPDEMVSPLGFEPRTQGLKVPRSAAELRAHAV